MSQTPSVILHKERPVCPACRCCFTISDSGVFHHRAKCPMVLWCGHTACSMCLRLAARNKQFSCPSCKQLTDMPDENAYKLLPLNYHLMGSVFANTSLDIDTRFNVKFKRNELPTARPVKPVFSSKTDICNACVEKETNLICFDCNLSFCQECYFKIHEDGESELEHRHLPVIPIMKKISSQLCAEHDDVKMYFCNTDSMLVCAHCTATGAHNGHTVVHICEKNKAFEEEVRSAVEVASNVGRCLTHSKKELKKLASAIEARTQKVAIEIHKEFSELHAILELREHELNKVVQKSIEEKAKFINQVICQVENNQQRLKALLSDSEERLLSKTEVLSPEWIKQITQIQDLPCYFEMAEQEMSTRIDSIISKPAIDSTFLTNHSFLNGVQNNKTESIVEMAKIQDVATETLELFSEDVESDSEEEIFTADISMPELESLSNHSLDVDDSTQEDIINSESSKTTTILANKKTFNQDPLQTAASLSVKPRNWALMRPEIVQVIYTINPTHFYIRRSVDKAAFNSLRKCIKQWCHTSNKENTSLELVKLGDLCLAFNRILKCYGRALVTEVLNQSRGETAGQGVKVVALFIDHGNTENIYKDRLYRIPMEFTALPALAIRCSLHDINPVNTEMGWSGEAIKLFMQFTKNIPALMTIIEIVGDTLHVDIGRCQMPSKTPSSIRANLIFMGFGCFARKPYVPDDSSEVLPSPEDELEKYAEPELPEKGVLVTAIVSHINSPEHFYIQLANYSSSLTEILKQMNVNYRTSRPSEDHCDLQLGGPRKGMVCKAQFHDQRWYRAEVLNVLDEEKVEIFYVDYGNTEVVNHSQIKQLFPKFRIWPKMAIECRLTNVQPRCVDNAEVESDEEARREWSDEAKLYFYSQVTDKVMRLIIEEIVEKKLVVSLYTSTKPKICLNAELVVKGFAEPISTSDIEKITLKTAEKEESAKDLPTTAQIVDPDFRISQTTLMVRLSHVVSPDEMYAQLVGTYQELETLSKALQKVYKNTEPDDTPWSCDEFCAVFDFENKLWYRGKIQKKCDGDTVEVFLFDYGNTLTVKTDKLRVILEEFLVDQKYAFRCHLVGILAPGGGSKWPVMTNTFLKELADKFKPIYMKKMGPVTDGMPVHVFGKEIKKPGALEPIIETEVSFAEKLVEEGLALPVRSRTPAEAFSFSKSIENLNGTELSELGASDTDAELLQKQLGMTEKQWPPPQPRLKVGQKFTAFPTNVNYEGGICLHDKIKNGPTLEYITLSLKEKYDGTVPLSHDLYWLPDQMCIAQFQQDEGWYRAKVEKVKDGMVTVHFIDYGNEETMNPAKLRKEVILEETPQQAFHCDLYGIAPVSDNGRWTKQALDFVHKLICEKEYNAVVMALPKGENPKISLSLVPNVTVEQTMVDMGYAVYVKAEDDVELEDVYIVEEEATEEPVAYKDLDQVPFGETFRVVVSEILGPNVFYVQRLTSEESDQSEYQKEIASHCYLLQLFSDMMNEAAENWPTVVEAKVGLVCCAPYNGLWFRAVIVEHEEEAEENNVAVFYVDFGNIELLSMDRLRVLPGELLELPKQAIRCQLHQVAPVDEWSNEIIEKFTSIYEEEELHAIVKSCGSPVKVDLLVYNSDTGLPELAYQNLVDSNLIKLVIERKETL